MTIMFGEWIKEQRKILGISQAELSDRTGRRIPQSTISMWEKGKNENPSAQNVKLLVESLGIPINNFSWDYVIFNEKNAETRCNRMKERFRLYELSAASSLKTFEGKVYQLKGCVGIETETGEVRHISDLYYRTRTVVAEKQLLAKRKTPDEELIKIKGVKKVK